MTPVIFEGNVVNYGNVTSYHMAMVDKLAKRMGTETLDLLHGAVGVSGEAGELLDAIKKAWVYNKPLDRDNVIEELGDIEFYLQIIREVLVISREETLHANMRKLQKRYSSGTYSDTQAQDRADKTEEN